MEKVIYAIGDVHGVKTLLDEMLLKILQHSAGRKFGLVFLGDLVDRGPDSAGVVQTVMDLTTSGIAVCLKGNHEDLMLGANPATAPHVLRGDEKPTLREWRDMEDRMSWWTMNGGYQTMESYGGECARVDPYTAYREIDKSHLEWMEALPTWYETDTHYFVHAGVNPNRPLDSQSDHHRLWIRDEWLESGMDMGKHVVHGHTPRSPEPELESNRTNLDTGAFYYGVLTAGVFLPTDKGSPSEVLQVKTLK